MLVLAVAVIVVIETGVLRGHGGSCPELFNARTHISSDPPHDVRFAVYGDVQGGYTTFDSIVNEIEKDGGIDFVMCAGDMVANPVEDEYETFCSRLVSHKPKTPCIFMAGNHDETKSEDALFRIYFGDPYYSFAVGKTLFVALNNGEDAYLPEQYEWLEGLLKSERAKYDSLVLFMHKPPVVPASARAKGKLMKPEDLDRLYAILKDYNPTAIFSGHIHMYSQMNWNGIPVYICGGGGGNLEMGAKHHWLEVTVRDGAVSVTMHPIK
jgi:3',5'-cyclic AMP phosphodiesterase CpdA